MLEYKTNIPDIGFVTIKKFFNSKSIKISINTKRGILISTPVLCSNQKAIDFCISKKHWVLNQLEKINSKKENNIFRPDSKFKTRKFELSFSMVECKKLHVKVEKNIINFYYNSLTNFNGNDVQFFIKKVIANVLKFEAESYIIPRCKEIASNHNINFRSINIGKAKTRWACCSSNNIITFSSSMMLLPDELIDFIILHEFCHIYHKNHGEKFHNLLNNYLEGKEKELIKKLRKYNTEIVPGDFSFQKN